MTAQFNLGNPADILSNLGRRLDTRQGQFNVLKGYFEGEQTMAYVSPEVRSALAGRIDSLVINWPALLVNSIAERLTPEGFVIPEQEQMTERLNQIWQNNSMDEQSQNAIIESLLFGRSYAIVWADEQGAARISVESARQMIAWRNPATRIWEAAVKRWVEEDGFAYGVVYTAERVTLLKSKSLNSDTSDLYAGVEQQFDISHVSQDGWTTLESYANPLSELPVAVLPNNPGILSPEGTSELSDVLPLADAINKMATDMMVTSEFFAAPRRWATGVEIEEDENGDLKDDFEGEKTTNKGRWHLFENQDSDVGQFEEATLDNFAVGLDQLTKYLAGVKKIPVHYLDPAKSGLASAEAVRAAEAPLVVLAKRKMVPLSGGFESLARLALMVESGDLPSAAELKMETQWADPENLTASQKVDAVSKKAALQVPVEQLWRDAGYTDQQIEEMKRMRSEEQAAAPRNEDDSESSGGRTGSSGAGRPGERAGDRRPRAA